MIPTGIMAEILSIVSQLTPVDLLMGSNGALAVALVALYRDCKSDRAKLWAELRRLRDGV